MKNLQKYVDSLTDSLFTPFNEIKVIRNKLKVCLKDVDPLGLYGIPCQILFSSIGNYSGIIRKNNSNELEIGGVSFDSYLVQFLKEKEMLYTYERDGDAFGIVKIPKEGYEIVDIKQRDNSINEIKVVRKINAIKQTVFDQRHNIVTINYDLISIRGIFALDIDSKNEIVAYYVGLEEGSLYDKCVKSLKEKGIPFTEKVQSPVAFIRIPMEFVNVIKETKINTGVHSDRVDEIKVVTNKLPVIQLNDHKVKVKLKGFASYYGYMSQNGNIEIHGIYADGPFVECLKEKEILYSYINNTLVIPKGAYEIISDLGDIYFDNLEEIKHSFNKLKVEVTGQRTGYEGEIKEKYILFNLDSRIYSGVILEKGELVFTSLASYNTEEALKKENIPFKYEHLNDDYGIVKVPEVGYEIVTKINEIKVALSDSESVWELYRSLLQNIPTAEFPLFRINWRKILSRECTFNNIKYEKRTNTKEMLSKLSNESLTILNVFLLGYKSKINLDESKMNALNRKQLLLDFIQYCVDDLKLERPYPKLKLTSNKADTKTYGHFDPGTNELVVYVKGRNLGDICRTIAHELVHRQQAQNNKLTPESGKTGSPIENEANAYAGVLLRNFGEKNPMIFEIKTVNNKIKVRLDHGIVNYYTALELPNDYKSWFKSSNELFHDVLFCVTSSPSNTKNLMDFLKSKGISCEDFQNAGVAVAVPRICFEVVNVNNAQVDEIKVIPTQKLVTKDEFRNLLKEYEQTFGNRIKETLWGEWSTPKKFSYGTLYKDHISFGFYLENVNEDDKVKIEQILKTWTDKHGFFKGEGWADVHIYPNLKEKDGTNVRIGIYKNNITSNGGQLESKEDLINSLTEALVSPFNEIKILHNPLPELNPDAINTKEELSAFIGKFRNAVLTYKRSDTPRTTVVQVIDEFNKKYTKIINQEILPKIFEKDCQATKVEQIDNFVQNKIKLPIKVGHYVITHTIYRNINNLHDAEIRTFAKDIGAKGSILYNGFGDYEHLWNILGEIVEFYKNPFQILYLEHDSRPIIYFNFRLGRELKYNGWYSSNGFITNKSFKNLIRIKGGEQEIKKILEI